MASRNKYLWFLALYDGLISNKILEPEAAYQSLIDRRIPVFGPVDSQIDGVQSLH